MKTVCGKSWLERLGIITNKTIYRLLGELMETVEDFQSKLAEIESLVANVGGDVDSLIGQVAGLKDQLANGQVVTQENLEAFAAAAQRIKDSLSATDAKEPVA